MPARAAATTAWRGGICIGGTLLSKKDGSCDVFFTKCTFNPAPTGASAASSVHHPPTTYQFKYSSVTKAKTARRVMCKRLDRLCNEWRYWPGDPSHNTIQMKVSRARADAILFSKERMDVVARNVWSITAGKIRTRGTTINTARGENRINARKYAVQKCHSLMSALYLNEANMWRTPLPKIDADGFTNYDFTRWHLTPI